MGGGVGTGKGTGKSMRTCLSKLPFSDLPFSFSPSLEGFGTAQSCFGFSLGVSLPSPEDKGGSGNARGFLLHWPILGDCCHFLAVTLTLAKRPASYRDPKPRAPKLAKI